MLAAFCACAITSQNGTAPKRGVSCLRQISRAITSQNGTAPKLSPLTVAPSGRAITSQNGTAPKRRTWPECLGSGAITSQNGTAPKRGHGYYYRQLVRLPVRTALLQNASVRKAKLATVRLPVRTALLQNGYSDNGRISRCDYQSERHCSKTLQRPQEAQRQCDYQSERHCSKTAGLIVPRFIRAITSQNGTAPKLRVFAGVTHVSAITSQNGTAPKPLEQIPSLLRDGHSDRRRF
mgnify:CR=1 FL=1